MMSVIVETTILQ